MPRYFAGGATLYGAEVLYMPPRRTKEITKAVAGPAARSRRIAGITIKRAIKLLGLTPHQVATGSGVDLSTVKTLHTPHVGTIERLANFLSAEARRRKAAGRLDVGEAPGESQSLKVWRRRLRVDSALDGVLDDLRRLLVTDEDLDDAAEVVRRLS